MLNWMRRWTPGRTALFMYLLLAVGWLVWGAATFLYDKGQPEQLLDVGTATLVQLEELGERQYGVLGGDPQFVFEGADTQARRLVFSARFDKDPGEMALYYAREGGAFSDRRRVLGRPVDSGVWEYELPPGHVSALRLDPGNTGTNIFTVESVALNGDAPLWRYVLPNWRQLAGGVMIGALASCLICIIMRGYQAVHLKGRSLGNM